MRSTPRFCCSPSFSVGFYKIACGPVTLLPTLIKAKLINIHMRERNERGNGVHHAEMMKISTINNVYRSM